MRRYITGNVHTIRLGAAHLLQGDSAAQMREVHPPPRLPCQSYPSGNADFLTAGRDRLQARTRADKPIVHLTAAEELRLLGVLHQQGKISLCAVQSLPQKTCVGNGRAVIRKEHGPGLSHQQKLRQLLSFAPSAHRSGGKNTRPRLRSPLIQHIFHDSRAVRSRIRVRHRDQQGKTTRRPRHRTAGDVLPPLLPGIAHMAVQVDKPGGKNLPFKVTNLRIGRRNDPIGGHLRHVAILYQQRHRLLVHFYSIKKPAILQQSFHLT